MDDEILLPKLIFGGGFQGKAGEWFASYLKSNVHTMKA